MREVDADMTFENVLKDINNLNKEYAEEAEKERMDPIRCLTCYWILSVNSKGEKACPWCSFIGRR